MRMIYPVLVIPLLASMLIAITLTLFLNDSAYAAPMSTMVQLPGSIPAVLAQSKKIDSANLNQTISMSLGLRLRNSALLKSYVADIARKGSPNFRRFLTPTQLIGAFSPSVTIHNAVLQYLRDSGFTITHTYKHRMLISFTGTIGLAERVFHVTIDTYLAPNGEPFYSNNSDPLFPASLAGGVQIIYGLNDAVRYEHTPLATRRLVTRKTSPSSNGGICPDHGNGYYTPDQTASAYNLNGLYNAGYKGDGQSLALFELDTFKMGDLTTYESCYGQSPTPIYTIVSHAPVPTDGGVAEVELDAELVLSAAPKLGQLRIYEASNNSTGYNDEWAQIIQDDSPVVSSSWGTCEANLNQAEATYENDNIFSVAAAQGQSVFAASGDTGSSGCLRNAGSQVLSAGDPAAQPFVTGVGGTSLTLDNSGGYGSEVVWNNSSGASGGGLSQYWPIPSWQQNAPGVINQFYNGNREEPDVSLNADPSKGYVIFCSSTAAGCAQPGFYVFGGTSAAAPMWAAMLALTNEESLKGGGFDIGFVNPLLYQIDGNSNAYASGFNDVTAGNNDFKSLQNGRYPATPNYDMATGLGSYNAASLAQELINFSSNSQSPTPASMTWYFAEGSVGGSFQEYITITNPSLANPANVSIKYLIQGSTPVTVTHQVNSSSRAQFNVNTDLGISPTGPHHSVAAIVTSDVPIVAERPMYFKNVLGISSGTDAFGETTPQRAYYFSEANSTQSGSANYSTFLTMLNPSTTLTDTVNITYYTGSCGGTHSACPVETITLGPLQRGTASPTDHGIGLHQKLAISVTSDNPVVVERPMYFKDTIPNVGLTSGATSEVGATAPGTQWLFAEGYTANGFQEYYKLANFGTTDANVKIALEYSNGSIQNVTVKVPALGFSQFDVNAHKGPTSSVSADITSDQNIVADRLMYFHFGSSHISGGTDVVGTPAAQFIYTFSEGFTGSGFSEFLTLQNPLSADEKVVITFFTTDDVFEQQIVVKGNSRRTINVNNAINAVESGGVSMTVEALSGTIVAERPIYFINPPIQGGTDVIGFTYPSCGSLKALEVC